MTQLPSVQEKEKLRQQLATLQFLYEQKSRREGGGTAQSGTAQSNTMLGIRERNAVQQTEQTRKEQIIKEELQRTKEFLRLKQRPSTNLKQMHYGSLFEDGGAAFLLALKGNSLRDRSRVVQMVFDRLSQDGRIVKSVLKDFLRANKEFRERFSIRDEDVHRQIDVHTDSPFLDYPQLYEFVSACHLTNPIIYSKPKRVEAKVEQKGLQKNEMKLKWAKQEKKQEKEKEEKEKQEKEEKEKEEKEKEEKEKEEKEKEESVPEVMEYGWKKEEGKGTTLAELDAQFSALSVKHATEIAWDQLVPPKRFRG